MRQILGVTLLMVVVGLNFFPSLWDLYVIYRSQSPEVENIGYMPGEVISRQTGVLDVCPPGVGPHGEDTGDGGE